MAPLDAADPSPVQSFNRGFEWLSDRYGSTTAEAGHRSTLMLLIYGGLLGLTVLAAERHADRLHPRPGPGLPIGVIQLPPGSSLERTEAA